MITVLYLDQQAYTHIHTTSPKYLQLLTSLIDGSEMDRVLFSRNVEALGSFLGDMLYKQSTHRSA